MKRTALIAMILLAMAVCIAVFLWRRAATDQKAMSMIEFVSPGLIPTSALCENLRSGDLDLTRETLAILAGRKDPEALNLAIPLLQNTDDYVWLNAAHYVGACGREEAVPYLIKGLRHTAWRADEETVRLLQKITGKQFGTAFSEWQQWWRGQHLGSAFDWESHLGSSPRVSRRNAIEHPRSTDAAVDSDADVD